MNVPHFEFVCIHVYLNFSHQIFLFEYDDDALPTKHPRHCLPYAVISLVASAEKKRNIKTNMTDSPPAKSRKGEVLPVTDSLLGASSSCKYSPRSYSSMKKMGVEAFDGDEKENGVRKTPNTEEREQALKKSESPTGLTRMKLSDRFANITPSPFKLDNPKLEEVRQKHQKAFEKLQAVRTERLNNAMLGFGSSSEDDQYSSSISVLKSCTNESQVFRFDSKKKESNFPSLKITIPNARQLSSAKDPEVDNSACLQHGKEQGEKRKSQETQQFENSKTTEVPGRLPDDSVSLKDKEKQNINQRSTHQMREFAHRKGKQSCGVGKWRSYSSDTKRSSSDQHQRNRCDARPNRHGFGRSQRKCGRGGYRGRGRMRFHCPEYFQSGDTSHVFDMEEELYEAAAGSSRKAQSPIERKFLSPDKTCEKKTTVSQLQDEVNFEKRFSSMHSESQSHDHSSVEGRKHVSSSLQFDQSFQKVFESSARDNTTANIDVGCHNFVTEAAPGDLYGYKRSLGLAEVSHQGSCEPVNLKENNKGLHIDNMEVQDMDVVCDTSRDPWAVEGSQSSLQSNPAQSYYQTSPVPQNSHPLHRKTNSGNLGISKPASTTYMLRASEIHVSHSGVDQQGYPVQTFGQQDTSTKDLHVDGTYSQATLIAHAGTLPNNHVSGWKHAHSVEANREGNLPLDNQDTVPPSSFMNNAHILARVKDCLNYDNVNREHLRCSYHLEGSSISRKNTNEVPPTRKSKSMFFHGRPLLHKGKGKPLEILLDNIVGLNKPADPRAALSALFDRKFEIELKKVSWSSDMPLENVPVDGPENKSIRKKEVSKDAKDPVMTTFKQVIHKEMTSSCRTPPECISSNNYLMKTSVAKSEHSNEDSIDDHATQFPQKPQHVKISVEAEPSDQPTQSDGNHAAQVLQKIQHLRSLDKTVPSDAKAMVQLPQNFKHEGSLDKSVSYLQPTESVATDSTAQLLQKLKHVSCLDIGPGSLRLSSRQMSHPQAPHYSSAEELKHARLSPDKTACQPSVAESVCSDKSSTSLSVDSQGKSRYQRLSPLKSTCCSVQKGRSPHQRSKTSKRNQSQHRDRSPKRSVRSPHRRRSRSPYSCSRSRSTSHERNSRQRSFSEECSTFMNEESFYKKVPRSSESHYDDQSFLYKLPERHTLTEITAEMSSLRYSAYEAVKEASSSHTVKRHFACLTQYNNLWHKATQALQSMNERKNSASELNRAAFEADIEKYEDTAANIHLQLESLVLHFDSDDLNDAGIQDWDFRPFSGVMGLSERGHLKVLHRLKDMYKQQHHMKDLQHLVSKKMNLLEKKLRSTDRQEGFSQHRFQQHHLDTPVSTASMIPTVIHDGHPNNAPQFNIHPYVNNVGQYSEYSQDVRRVVLRNLKTEIPHQHVDQQGFGTSSATPQNPGKVWASNVTCIKVQDHTRSTQWKLNS